MYQFKLPDLGEGVHEGQVVSVLIKVGDTIKEYTPMMEVETDKAAVEIPAPVSGVVKKLNAEPGQVVHVGDVLVEIDEGGEGAGEPPKEQKAEAGEKPREEKPAARRDEAEEPSKQREARRADDEEKGGERPRPAGEPARREQPAARRSAGSEERSGHTAVAVPPANRSGPVPAAPAVRKLAREMGVELAEVNGTGSGGRVLREDVERYALGHRGGEPRGRSGDGRQLVVPGGELPDFGKYGEVRREAVPQIRKTIANQMTRAWLNVPRVTHCDAADVTDVERFRKQLELPEGQAKVTMTAIVIRAIVGGLQRHAMLNCSFDAENSEIIYKEFVNIGIAVDTPRGLVVPVMRDVQRMSLLDIANALADIGARARSAKFEVNELRGASFTITNVGALGGSFVTPMVNYPEVGILALGRAAQQPVVRDGQIVARLMLPLSLSFDHRVVDGADGARFTRDVIDSLENPLRLCGA